MPRWRFANTKMSTLSLHYKYNKAISTIEPPAEYLKAMEKTK